MNVVYPQRWQRQASPLRRQAEELAPALKEVEEELRQSGFEVAADLLAAAEIAMWRGVFQDQE